MVVSSTLAVAVVECERVLRGGRDTVLVYSLKIKDWDDYGYVHADLGCSQQPPPVEEVRQQSLESNM
jgi:hypothetical protein